MSKRIDWQMELDEYTRQGTPEEEKKCKAWKVAIGLQDVDGLAVSRYLIDTAKQHIEGIIEIDDAQEKIAEYYNELSNRACNNVATREADIVSSRIAKIVNDSAFKFSPEQWKSIHKYLFEDIYDNAGEFRKYNISKMEWILKGNSVIYAPWDNISDLISYDFDLEKKYSYEGKNMEEIIRHISKFTCDIWQIHPFLEGNTRSTAVFIIQYLNYLGFKVDNKPFEKNAWYFRNALVRANYNDILNGVYSTNEYLDKFFANLLVGENYELKNRYLHLDYNSERFEETEFEYSSASYSIVNDSYNNLDYIIQMEEYYDTLCEALESKGSFSNFNDEEKAMLASLTEYYEGGQWLKDYEADEQGLLPKGLKRGILAQDTLYDFFQGNE